MYISMYMRKIYCLFYKFINTFKICLNFLQVPTMLDECLEFLEAKTKAGNFSYEVIIVSDGSSDGTVSLALKYSKKFSVEKVRVLELIENRGKGGAVRLVSYNWEFYYQIKTYVYFPPIYFLNHCLIVTFLKGMLSARGRNLLFADADGATKFSDYDKLADAMQHIASDWKDDAVVIGSRAHLENEAIATRSAFR